MPTETKNIAILFGGCSTEYEISLQSAYAVIRHLDRTNYTPILIGIEKKTGIWRRFGEPGALETGDPPVLRRFCRGRSGASKGRDWGRNPHFGLYQPILLFHAFRL